MIDQWQSAGLLATPTQSKASHHLEEIKPRRIRLSYCICYLLPQHGPPEAPRNGSQILALCEDDPGPAAIVQQTVAIGPLIL